LPWKSRDFTATSSTHVPFSPASPLHFFTLPTKPIAIVVLLTLYIYPLISPVHFFFIHSKNFIFVEKKIHLFIFLLREQFSFTHPFIHSFILFYI